MIFNTTLNEIIKNVKKNLCIILLKKRERKSKFSYKLVQ